MYPTIDFHCDWLAYLMWKPGRTIHDPEPRCSLPQLKEGNVKLQIQALGTPTMKDSVKWAESMKEHLRNVPLSYFDGKLTDEVKVVAAYENASGFCLEDEPLEVGLERLEKTHAEFPLLYISLTWNGENRFGGGCGSASGLKEEGKILIDWMKEKGVFLDLSHASDRLANEALSYYDGPVMASHSNFRAVCDMERNLPDEIAREIIARKGVIGLVFLRPFVGKTIETIYEHIEHGIALGGKEHLGFGADFFCDSDWESSLKKSVPDYGFFPEMQNASCYPQLMDFIAKRYPDEVFLNGLSHRNALEAFNLRSCLF